MTSSGDALQLMDQRVALVWSTVAKPALPDQGIGKGTASGA